MSSTVLVPNLLVANRKGIEELSRDGPHLLPFDSSFHKKRKTSSIVYDTRSFKRRKFSRSYIEKNLQNKRGSSRFSKRRHHVDILQEINVENPSGNVSQDDSHSDSDTNAKTRKLRTHVWNAKRMHMEDIYGCMVPVSNHRHGVKATTRLFNNEKKTFIHDFSYHNILQLNFQNLEITGNVLGQVMDPNCIFFQTLISGNILLPSIPFVEHNILIYEKNAFPMGLIGPCKVMMTVVRDTTSSDPISFQMWISCHPGITSAIINLFDAINGVSIKELQHVDRLTLFGMEAQSILQGLCAVSKEHPTDKIDGNRTSVSSQISKFLSTVLSDSHQRLCNVWRSGYVLPALVSDPRVTSSLNKKEEDEMKQSSLRWPKISTYLPSFPLWQSASQDFNSTPLSDYEINQTKHKHSEAELTSLFDILEGKPQNSNDRKNVNDDAVKIPLFLIHHRTQDQKSDNHYLSDKVLPGFSIILPRNWTRVFWQMCISRGALPIGVEDIAYLQRSKDILTFPNDYLDSDCGWQHYQDRIRRIREQEEKKPVAKRLSWPYQSESSLLSLYLNHENVEEPDFIGSNCAVVRRNEYLQHFVINSDIHTISTEECEHPDWKLEQFTIENTNHSIPSLPEMSQTTYVHLKVTPTGRGQVHPFALIFEPSTKDLKEFILRRLERKKNSRAENHKKLSNTTTSKNSMIVDEWRGVSIDGDEGSKDINEEDDESNNKIEKNRTLIGTVTSGDDENGSNDHMGLALCRVDLVYDMMRCHFERFGHPLSHRLVLFQNPGSGWLRPGLVEYL